MPLKLNIGLSKKLGQPNYGSLGASCNVEIELDGSILQRDVEEFQKHVRTVYTACRQAVNEELDRQRAPASPAASGQSSGKTDNGQSHGRTNGTLARGTPASPTSQRRATNIQVRTLQALADQQELDLLLLLNERFQISNVVQLTMGLASQLIDELKSTALTDKRVA